MTSVNKMLYHKFRRNVKNGYVVCLYIEND